MAYTTTVEISSSESIPKEVFIKKRTINFVNDSNNDVFVAVATPAQIEDLPVDNPEKGSSYFRTYKTELIGKTIEEVDAILRSMVAELNKLTLDMETIMSSLTEEKTYVIG